MTFEEYKNLKKGQWIFTCAMKPLQFSHIVVRNRKDWADVPEEKWDSIQYDDFFTIEGSSHSKANCGCQPISEAYALWFLKNEIYTLFDKYKDDTDNRWRYYKADVMVRCFEAGIEFEGI